MSSNLKVNNILPSTGANIGLGTASGTLNVDGGCKVQVGTALTLGHTQGVQFHTQNLHSQGFEINQINASGIITASSFSGSGANLTSLPSQLTLSNNADNRIITGGSGTNLNGEANLTFNGTALGITGYADIRTGSSINTNVTGASSSGTLHKNTNSGEFAIVSGGTGGNNHLSFYTSASAAPVERVRINQHGGLRVFAAASDPTGIQAGEIYYNTSTNRLRVYNGSKWLNPDENKDPYASDVVCQFNGDSYTDLTGRHTLTQVGSGGLSNNYMSPVGSTHTYRMAHSNSTGNYMNITGNLGDFRLDDGNWTMEFWVRTTGTNGYHHYFIADGQNTKGTFKGYTNNSSVTQMAYFYSSNGSGVTYNPGGSPFAYNDWQHYAWDRSGSTTRFYLDGVVRASSTAAYPGGVPGSCNIGKWSNEAREFYMDNFRFTRGQARYGGNGFEVPRTKYTSG